MISHTEGHTSPTSQTLKAVTIAALKDCSFAKFYPDLFDQLFDKQDVTFDKFKTFIHQCMDNRSLPFTKLEEEIEEKCWQQCKDLYPPSLEFGGTLLKQLWQIYLRLVETGTYPTVILKDDLEWFMNNICSTLSQNGSQPQHPKEIKDLKAKANFSEFLTAISNQFSEKYDETAMQYAIEEMHTWLVLEITKVGWLNKRKRKQANWTSWLQRWFILSPGRLTYYDGPRCAVKKGELLITSKTVLIEVSNQRRAIFRKLTYTFKLLNKPYLEMEMSTADADEYKSWIAAISDMIASSKLGTTQVQILLEKRRVSKIETDDIKLKDIKNTSCAMKRIVRGSGVYDNVSISSEPSSPVQILPQVDEQEGLAESAKEIREKVSSLYCDFDANGDGFIVRSEFRDFISKMGPVDLDKTELDELFDSIDRDRSDSITFDEFYEYFGKVILASSFETSILENKLRTEFFKAEQEGSSAVNFTELVEVTQEQLRCTERERFEETFKGMVQSGEGGEMPLEKFQELLHADDGPASLIRRESKPFEKRLMSVYKKADHEKMASYIKERWNKFASFKRYGAAGDLVMKGGSGMVADVLPGQYNLLDLACFSDRDAIEPRKVVVKGAQWVKSPDPGQSGMIVFPSDYDGSIPVDIATTEHARYYGCHLADSTQIKVSLMYRHGIQDFTYQNNYLNDYVQDVNGAGLERHEFSHLDCPLEDDSGYFILGKIVKGKKEEELHLTAFVIPTRHTLYVAPNVIHCNDYLKGTWRTMLSDEADIDHYNVVKRPPNVHNAHPKNFIFKMAGRLA